MCGIAGAVNWGDRAVLERMTTLLAHRGPDDAGLHEEVRPDGTRIGLGNRRLAIQDLSPAGHMPMSTDDGQFTITYNGEVYNAPALRDELIARGHRFRSHSDTEVVLQMYQEFGPDSVRRLNGIFAFAIIDRQRDHLFLARDHFGVKPLYYCHSGERFAFASEVKAFRALPGFAASVDAEALQQYLTFLWVPDPLTMFSGVLKLPAGHFGVLKAGELRIQQYWDLQVPAECHRYIRRESELKQMVRSELERCVREQMISDVPLGAFLSGGLDSSTIVALMSRISAQPVKTYNITFPKDYLRGETTLDDPAIASDVARAFGCDHHMIEVRPDVASLLPKLIYHMDEPTADPALIMAYLVCHEARKDVTVLLSGVGGDELFGGYRKYQAYYWARLYSAMPKAFRTKMLEPAIDRMPPLRGTALKGWMRLLKKMARTASYSPQDAFLLSSTYQPRDQISDLLTPDLRSETSALDPWSAHLQHLVEVNHADFLHEMMYLDLKTFLVSLNLNYNDKMSMAASVEVRVPFLDVRLAELMMNEVAPALKVHGAFADTSKYLLRETMRSLLPNEVLTAPKAGFGAPIDAWVGGELRDTIEELLSPRNVAERGFFRPEAVTRMLKTHRAGEEDLSYQIWQLLTFELWCQVFLDGRADEFAVSPAAIHVGAPSVVAQ